MPEPYSYNASAESIRLPEPPPTAPPTPRIEGDPLSSFEQFHFQVQTDLRAWMTFAKADRFKKAVAYAKLDTENNDFRIDAARRHKILNYIIYIESHHPAGGSRDVAGVAFNALFPKPHA